MDEILHHLETMGDHGLLVFTGESSFQGFLDGAQWISSIHSTNQRQGKQSLLKGLGISNTTRDFKRWDDLLVIEPTVLTVSPVHILQRDKCE